MYKKHFIVSTCASKSRFPLSAGSPHSLEETEATGRETGKNSKCASI